MTRLERVLRDITIALSERSRNFAVVGGLAVSARAEPRFTRDVDVAVAVTGDPDAEDLVHSLLAQGYVVVAAIEQEAVHRLATVRLSPPFASAGGVVADLLLASSGVELEVADAADMLEILPGLVVPVATVGHLLALKTLSHGTHRPKDLMDIHALAAVASPSDLELARTVLTMIEARGFHRGKRLLDEFARLLPDG